MPSFAWTGAFQHLMELKLQGLKSIYFGVKDVAILCLLGCRLFMFV